MLKFLGKADLQNKVGVVIGTRPGIIMFSPIIRELEKRGIDFFIIHSGQHYSQNMDKIFFEQLEIIPPKYHLKGVSDKKLHGAQTAAMIEGIEKVLINEKPSIVLVGGDANTNLAGALAARKLHISVGHVEAGERSYDWRMPEEHNRRIIDHISDFLFATNEKGRKQAEQENILGKIFVTGNTIVDAVFQNIKLACLKSSILEEFGLREQEYIVFTCHREENVDSKRVLSSILASAGKIYKYSGLSIFFAAHPRTLNRLEFFELSAMAAGIEGLMVSKAPGYLDFLRLVHGAKLIMTDSGGVQQEACILKVPCVTLRKSTEWTETLEIGANRLAGVDQDEIVRSVRVMLNRQREWDIPFGDGNAGKKIVEIVGIELGR